MGSSICEQKGEQTLLTFQQCLEHLYSRLSPLKCLHQTKPHKCQLYRRGNGKACAFLPLLQQIHRASTVACVHRDKKPCYMRTQPQNTSHHRPQTPPSPVNEKGALARYLLTFQTSFSSSNISPLFCARLQVLMESST